MRSELEIAEAWHAAWGHAISMMDERTAWRWHKRGFWALHRFERARRALLPSGPRCPFCERPGHDEEEESCLVRQRVVGYWEVMGWIWRGEEGA